MNRKVFDLTIDSVKYNKNNTLILLSRAST